MIKQHIGQLISTAIEAAQRDGLLPITAIPELGLEHPPQPELGDFACSVALRLSRAARMNPLQIAKIIAERIPVTPEIARVNVAPPGFINVHLDDVWVGSQVEEVIGAGDDYGRIELGPKTVQIEFVSANPVGPLHVGNGRGAVLGDSLANVLAFAGRSVEREYYINDAGVQIRTFARTLLARYRQAFGEDVPLPEDGYAGQYMIELAGLLKEQHGSRFIDITEDAALIEIAPLGMAIVLDWIRRDAEDLGVKFDGWFSEKSLFDSGLVDEALAILRSAGRLVEREGAVWFTSASSVKAEDGTEETVTSGGDDKDNVVIRSNGSPTYFATDIAYHYDKLGRRRYDDVIDIWGADHHGHVARMKSVVEALGFDSVQLTVILYQLVTLKRGGELVRISKRTGDIITLREVIDEVGADACRYFFLARSADSQMDFDLAIAKEQSDKNPVYYIQYAHARIASILRRAEDRGIDFSDGDTALLVLEPELTLIRKMLQLPELIEQAAEQLQPHVLPHYAGQLAATFHSFYKQCKVVSDAPEELPISKARLKLVAAAKIALANTLRLMGMSTPERMDRAAETEEI